MALSPSPRSLHASPLPTPRNCHSSRPSLACSPYPPSFPSAVGVLSTRKFHHKAPDFQPFHANLSNHGRLHSKSLANLRAWWGLHVTACHCMSPHVTAWHCMADRLLADYLRITVGSSESDDLRTGRRCRDTAGGGISAGAPPMKSRRAPCDAAPAAVPRRLDLGQSGGWGGQG